MMEPHWTSAVGCDSFRLTSQTIFDDGKKFRRLFSNLIFFTNFLIYSDVGAAILKRKMGRALKNIPLVGHVIKICHILKVEVGKDSDRVR